MYIYMYVYALIRAKFVQLMHLEFCIIYIYNFVLLIGYFCYLSRRIEEKEYS